MANGHTLVYALGWHQCQYLLDLFLCACMHAGACGQLVIDHQSKKAGSSSCGRNGDIEDAAPAASKPVAA